MERPEKRGTRNLAIGPTYGTLTTLRTQTFAVSKSGCSSFMTADTGYARVQSIIETRLSHGTPPAFEDRKTAPAVQCRGTQHFLFTLYCFLGDLSETSWMSTDCHWLLDAPKNAFSEPRHSFSSNSLKMRLLNSA